MTGSASSVFPRGEAVRFHEHALTRDGFTDHLIAPGLPAPGGLCAIHQPNFLPRLTTPAKLFAADHWIVLNDVRFARRRSWLPVLDAFATGRTAAVAETSTRVLPDVLGWKGRILTSSRLPSRPGRSQRLADRTPFEAQGIAVIPFQPPPRDSAPRAK